MGTLMTRIGTDFHKAFDADPCHQRSHYRLIFFQLIFISFSRKLKMSKINKNYTTRMFNQ